jgi:hypothetical protein
MRGGKDDEPDILLAVAPAGACAKPNLAEA